MDWNDGSEDYNVIHRQAEEIRALRTALEGLAVQGVTAGANPLLGGGMSPPLWHMKCDLCGERWSKQTWDQPRQHPPGKCILAGGVEA